MAGDKETPLDRRPFRRRRHRELWKGSLVSTLAPPQQHAQFSIIDLTVQFAREHWLKFLLISATVLVPCFWHRHIEAGDLGSHTYNAWIAHLISTGRAHGLWLAQRWNNVLFDLALSGLGNLFGWLVAERIATCGAVLIFFWGSFALVCAIARCLPWFLFPAWPSFLTDGCSRWVL